MSTEAHSATSGPRPAPAGSDTAALIAGAGIVLARQGVPVLETVDISVTPQETVTVVGPNGAGKTSLLQVLLGLVRPDEGSVTRLPNLRIGYLPQLFPLDASLPLTVRRFLSLGVSAPYAERLRRLEEVGAGAVVERPLHRLSGGELRRVLLARALLRKPDLLVLDEPLQGVDLAGQMELYELIARVARTTGAAVLMVSHDLHFVMATTDRVVCLNRHICCEGEPETVREHPEYKALLGGEASAVAVYTHHHDHVHDASGEVVQKDGSPESESGRAAHG